MSVSTVTLSTLCENDITGKTISAYLQITISAGTYQAGGLAAGLVAYADAHTIDTAAFLKADINGEGPVGSSPSIGVYGYRYVPSTDTIQITQSGAEISATAIPAGVVNDTIVGKFTWNRI